MPKEAKKEMAKGVKQIFSKTNRTQAKGIVTVTKQVRRWGFWNAVEGGADYVIEAFKAHTIGTFATVAFYLFLRWCERYSMPRQLRRELDRLETIAEVVEPGVRAVAHRTSEILPQQIPYRFWNGVRSVLRRATFGYSELAIEGIQYLLDHTLNRELMYGPQDVDMPNDLQAAFTSASIAHRRYVTQVNSMADYLTTTPAAIESLLE